VKETLPSNVESFLPKEVSHDAPSAPLSEQLKKILNLLQQASIGHLSTMFLPQLSHLLNIMIIQVLYLYSLDHLHQ